MTQHNVGALVVVKPGADKAIAGIITERGNQFTLMIVAGESCIHNNFLRKQTMSNSTNSLDTSNRN